LSASPKSLNTLTFSLASTTDYYLVRTTFNLPLSGLLSAGILSQVFLPIITAFYRPSWVTAVCFSANFDLSRLLNIRESLAAANGLLAKGSNDVVTF